MKQTKKRILYFPSPSQELNPVSPTITSLSTKGGSKRPDKSRKSQNLHPIDQRLSELGKTRCWLADQVQRTPQCIGNYCNRKIMIRPDSLLTMRICKVLAVDLNYLILGRSHFQAQNFSQINKNGIQPEGKTQLKLKLKKRFDQG